MESVPTVLITRWKWTMSATSVQVSTASGIRWKNREISFIGMRSLARSGIMKAMFRKSAVLIWMAWSFTRYPVFQVVGRRPCDHLRKYCARKRWAKNKDRPVLDKTKWQFPGTEEELSFTVNLQADGLSSLRNTCLRKRILRSWMWDAEQDFYHSSLQKKATR